MEIIKSYTDLEQSKKLAEILLLESADMCYLSEESLFPKVNYNGMVFFNSEEEKPSTIIPCWSLAALLGVLPERYTELIKEGGMYRIIIKDSYMTCLFGNPIDACVAMIERLHELNLL